MADKADLLIYPGDPQFEAVLAMPPPNWREVALQNSGEVVFVAQPESGLLRPASSQELTEYLYGGEYEERLYQLDAVE